MIYSFADKFLRLTYDNLKAFIVFFLILKMGGLLVDINTSFLIVLGFSSVAYFANYSNVTVFKNCIKKILPITGVVASYFVTVTFYGAYGTSEQVMLIIFHITIWLLAARNVAKRDVYQRAITHVLLPIIMLTVLIFGLVTAGLDIGFMMGVVFPYFVLFYPVSLMLAVKMNLDLGYKAKVNARINTINKKRNMLIFNIVPNLILMVIFYSVVTIDMFDRNGEYTAVIVEDEHVIEEEMYEEVAVEEEELKELRTGKKHEIEEETKKHWSLKIPVLKYIGPSIDIIILSIVTFLLYIVFKRFYSRFTIDEEDDDIYIEVKETLLTRDNIGKYFKNLAGKFRKKEREDLQEERDLYRKYVLKLIKRGVDFEICDTSNNYNRKVMESDRDEINSDGKKAFGDMTDVYNKYKYDGESCDLSKLKKLRKTYDEL